MRTLSSTLQDAQQLINKPPLWKCILSRTSATTRGYDRTRITKISHVETPSGSQAEISIQNQDNALTAIDFEHFQAEISYGYNTGITPATWAANTAYSLEDVVIPSTPNGYQYKCRVAGTSSGATETLRPNAAGDSNILDTESGPGDANNYTHVDEAVANDADYVAGVSPTIRNYDYYNLPSLSSLTQITSVKVYARLKRGSSGNAVISIKTAGSAFDSSVITLDTNWTSYNNTWATNPNTGLAWTVAEIAALQIGVGLLKDGGSGDAFCSQIYVEVTGYVDPTFPTTLGTQVSDGTVTWEMDGNQGDEYSRCAPLRCRAQELHSGRGILKLILRPIGILDQLGEDKATAGSTVAAGNTLTVQDWITLVAGATGLASYSTYSAVTLSYDSTDSVITTFQPAEYFAIRLNETRLSKVQELLSFTGTKMRTQNDGKLHFLAPTISGTAYNYEYKFNVASSHNFWSKTVRNRFVEPNKEIVTSPSGAGTVYAGTATSATSFALAPKVRTTELTLASSAQASSIAAAKIEQDELDAERAFAVVPMNVGQELWDYVKVTDSRQGDTITGNVQYIRRDVEIHQNSPLTWTMMIAFGRPSQLSIMSNMLDAGVSGGNFNEIISKTLNEIITLLEEQRQGLTFVEETYITASDSSIPGDLDDLADGTTYKRVLATAITAGNIRLSEAVGNLDDVDEGATYGKLRTTNLSAGNIKLTSDAVISGEWYNESGVALNATAGIKIWGIAGTAFQIRDTENGNVQIAANTAGQLMIGGTTILADSTGIRIDGAKLSLRDSSGNNNANFYVGTDGNAHLDGWGKTVVKDIIPDFTASRNLGASATTWANGYIESLGVTNLIALSSSIITTGVILPAIDNSDNFASSTNTYKSMFIHEGDGGTAPDTGEGSFSYATASTGELWIYTGGAWRANGV